MRRALQLEFLLYARDPLQAIEHVAPIANPSHAGNDGNAAARALPGIATVNSASNEGADLIEPAPQLGVFGQAGIVWGMTGQTPESE